MITKNQLYTKLNEHLNDEELQNLCFELDIDYDNLSGNIKKSKIRALLKQTSLEQILPFLRKSHPLIDWAHPVSTPTKPATLTPREREILLNRVQNGWINGVLKKSLHERAKLELGLEYDFNLQGTVAERQNVEFGKEIGEIFDEAGRQLLILGEPGSGKTTTLLMLADDLLERAVEDPNEPIPLILNLSTWTTINPTESTKQQRWWRFGDQGVGATEEQKPFERWLGQACFIQYSLNPEVTLSMLRNSELVFMLDALDEVGAEKMEECLQSINEIGLNEVVVSSRLKDYGAIETNLHVTTGVEILPLADQQIADYFEDKRFVTLKSVIEADKELKELARTPLMLSVMALAFEQASSTELNELETQIDKVDYIFNKYVDQMFIRRPVDSTLWKEADMQHWLSCLADIMLKHDQSIFALEGIQPNWLPLKNQVNYYRWIISLIFGISVVLAGILAGGLIEYINNGFVKALSQGLNDGFVFGLVFNIMEWLLGEFNGRVSEGLLGGLVGGGFFGLIIGTAIWFNAGQEIKIVTDVKWSLVRPQVWWESVKLRIVKLSISGLVFGLIFGISFLLIEGLFGGLTRKVIEELLDMQNNFRFLSIVIGSLVFILLNGLFMASFFIVFFMIILGVNLSIKKSAIQNISQPNKAIYLTIKNDLLTDGIAFGLIWGLLLGVLGGLSTGAIVGLQEGISFGLIGGLVLGVGTGLLLGLTTVIKHSAIRCLLSKYGYLPFPMFWQDMKLISFLDSATDRLLLQRVEGSWRFTHRSLQDHFAAQSPIIWEDDRIELNRLGKLFVRFTDRFS